MKRRRFLGTGIAGGLLLSAPTLVRAQTRQILIAGPSAQAKMFETDVQPIVEKRVGVKIVFDGSISVKHLQVLEAERSAPTYSLAWMPDTDMITAVEKNLLEPLDTAKIPNLSKLLPGAFDPRKPWVQMKVARFSVGINTDRVKPTLAAWADLWGPFYKNKVLVPAFQLTQGPMMLAMAAHLETGKPLAEAQYDVDAGYKRLRTLKPSILNVFSASPQAITLLEQGEAYAVVGLFSSVLYPRMRAGVPIDLPMPREGAFGSPNCLARIAKGPNAELANAVIDAMLDVDVQKIMMERTFDSPVRAEAGLVPGVIGSDKLFALDAAFWGKERAKIAPGYAAALA